MGAIGWRSAMGEALYGDAGFFVAPDVGPAGHFRTSVHASPLFAGALFRLIGQIDEALGRPDRFDVVDVGAGRGELLQALRAVADFAAFEADARGTRSFVDRVRWVGVEVAPRPAALPGDIEWRRDVPDGLVGLLVATEWLDNVPIDCAEVDAGGRVRRVLVDPASGDETLGPVVDAADAFWLARWWQLGKTGDRAEIGWPRDAAWADAVDAVRRGCAVAVDYGHLRDERPVGGTLTGFRDGRQVPAVPDGSCDVTAHVAVVSVAAGTGTAYEIIGQRAALKALGVDGGRPPLALASTDPAAYLRALGNSGAAAELTDPSGLGGHWWLVHGIGIDVPLNSP
jgi:SAM-dependent MidA family methyltransferase